MGSASPATLRHNTEMPYGITGLRRGSILFCLYAIPAVCADPGLNGIWQSEGYGNIFVIEGTHIESFQFTTTTCVKGPAAHFVDAGRKFKNSEGDSFTIRDGDPADHKLVHPGEMRLDRISALPPVCNHLTPNTPAANFEVFARSLAEQYVWLDRKHADWDALTERARRAITPATSPTQLFEIMKGLIEPFGDEHTGIYAPAIHREFEDSVPAATKPPKAKPRKTSASTRCLLSGALPTVFSSRSPAPSSMA
jgi:hypothetical protein